MHTPAAEDAEKGAFVPIAAFECRGLEPIGYRFEVSRLPTRVRQPWPRVRVCPAWLPALSQRPPAGPPALRAARSPLTDHGLCPGLGPTPRPQSDWVVQAANSSSKWDDVDLGEGEWTEYDEKAGESVGVFNTRHEWRVHRP